MAQGLLGRKALIPNSHHATTPDESVWARAGAGNMMGERRVIRVKRGR